MAAPLQPDDDPILLTVPEAADHAGTTVRTIRRWIAAGLPCWHRDGRTYVDLANLNQTEAATRRHGGKPRKWAALS